MAARAAPTTRRPARRKPSPTPRPLDAYLEKSRTPLTALLFVLPILVLHEVGVRWYGADSAAGVEYRVTAFAWLTRGLYSLGASGRYLPALVVVAVLLCIHWLQRERWVFNIPLLPLMVLESLLLAAPLLGVYFLFAPGAPTVAGTGDWKLLASLYLGAGVYEEFVFRLGAFAVLSFVLIDLGRIPQRLGTPIVVLGAAILFSAYHMWGMGSLPWQAFVFIGLRGVYYGIIFLERGFGVSVGVHTAYDLLFLTSKELLPR